ncbi:hypothetical protein [Algoriphagus sp.]|uniref:hypothetical protein n=1 Tax=Algoriphagus sp. TaxID=1872435 RepID=UPI00329959CC
MNNLHQPYAISPEAKAFYQENNFIKLKQVLSPEEVAHFNEVISAEVQRKNTQERPLEERDSYSKAFLQIFNLWTESV